METNSPSIKLKSGWRISAYSRNSYEVTLGNRRVAVWFEDNNWEVGIYGGSFDNKCPPIYPDEDDKLTEAINYSLTCEVSPLVHKTLLWYFYTDVNCRYKQEEYNRICKEEKIRLEGLKNEKHIQEKQSS